MADSQTNPTKADGARTIGSPPAAGPNDNAQRADAHAPVHSENYIGPIISLMLHAAFLFIAAILVINPPLRSGEVGEGTDVDLAGLSSQDISDLPDMGFEAPDPMIETSTQLSDASAEMLNADVSMSELSLSDAGATETLGGAGEDVDASQNTLGGGGGGTTFFGVAGKGRFFMYIVDVSGSMGAQNRLQILKDNLKSSIDALPEHTSFFIFAYNDREIPMTGPTQWRQADRTGKLGALRWINNLVDGGGTEPAGAFERAFKFQPIPDVIYFMTDGEDIQGLPEFVANLNDRGRKAKIHCIAFGNSGSEEMMRRIARQSGGRYRYVPVNGN